jgi:vacuolar-type H+-ATPase subunit F/Vma7
MGRVAVLGDPAVVRGWALAGLVPAEAAGTAQVRQRWAALPGDVSMVIVSREAAAALGDLMSATTRTVVVLP